MFGIGSPPIAEMSLVLALVGAVCLRLAIAIYNGIVLSLRPIAVSTSAAANEPRSFRYGRPIVHEPPSPEPVPRRSTRTFFVDLVPIPCGLRFFIAVWAPSIAFLMLTNHGLMGASLVQQALDAMLRGMVRGVFRDIVAISTNGALYVAFHVCAIIWLLRTRLVPSVIVFLIQSLLVLLVGATVIAILR